MKSDIEIAQSAKIKSIKEIAEKLGIGERYLDFYGKYKAKLSDDLEEKLKNEKDGKLVLVTAVNPTPAGEGKTTTTVGLGQAMQKLGKKALIAIREPSMGPVFGIKGGAAGGGYSQVLPMEDINLHFTGDMHAITSAHNLLSAIIDNHIQQGNELNIDNRKIFWKRAMDMNDRSLRQIVVGLGGASQGVPREDGFLITVASEIMAILCLSKNSVDLKKRIGEIVVALSKDKKIIKVKDLGVQGAMTALLKEAIKPNLVQTLEGSPALMHGGPFANIAHGCSSLRATKLGLKMSDVLITEAGFGADLGAEKFFDIKCALGGLRPEAVVLVATIRALKYNGGMAKSELGRENLDALKAGMENLGKHIENLAKFGAPAVVGLNVFETDTEAEIEKVKDFCLSRNVSFARSEVWAKGGEGGTELAEKVLEILDNKKSEFSPLYDLDLPVEKKIAKVATEIYGASGVSFSPRALRDLEFVKNCGADTMPVCIAKTQYSLSDDPAKLGRPKNFEINIKELKISAGAGFTVALAGDIMTMPGLPKRPAALNIDIDEEGNVEGLF